VLIAVASVALMILAMFVWFGVAVVFGRQFQFSIRSLPVLTVAVALPCSWLAMKMFAVPPSVISGYRPQFHGPLLEPLPDVPTLGLVGLPLADNPRNELPECFAQNCGVCVGQGLAQLG